MTGTLVGKAESVDLKTITLRKEQLKLIFLIYFCGVCVAQSLFFCVVVCRCVLVLLAIE
jgi:hypothetical protein